MFLLLSREQRNGSRKCLAWNSAVFVLLIYHNNVLSKRSAENNATVTVAYRYNKNTTWSKLFYQQHYRWQKCLMINFLEWNPHKVHSLNQRNHKRKSRVSLFSLNKIVQELESWRMHIKPDWVCMSNTHE